MELTYLGNKELHRLTKEGNQLATNCSQLKIMAADGKRYLTDCLPQSDMLQLMEATPSRHAMTFANNKPMLTCLVDCTTLKSTWSLLKA